MSLTATQLLLLVLILGIVEFNCASNTIVTPDFGCASGRIDGLFHQANLAACIGSWTGHVKNAQLCSSGWHVCNWRDAMQISAISFYQATHVNGCFAINAAQDGGKCQKCRERTREMAGIGADCPGIDDLGRGCLSSGRIYATFNSGGFASCFHRPWFSGVICCKDKKKGKKPEIKLSPRSSVRVPLGSVIELKCNSSGKPAPEIMWYKNGFPILADELPNDITVRRTMTSSKLTIPKSGPQLDGLYICRAENKYGFAVSYSSDVTSFSEESVACKNREKQVLLHGGTVAACEGKWKGSITKSSRQLCADGWKVCGLRERNILYQLRWDEVTSLSGCYAYNAATSDHFACTKCTHHHQGNRMAGVGSGCGLVDSKSSSCLRSGKINVWGLYGHRRKIRSCYYHEGITSGVLCCKRKAKSTLRRKDKKCLKPCGMYSHCSRRGICKCDSGFKPLGRYCVPTERAMKRCYKNRCLNGGYCKMTNNSAYCVCSKNFSGSRCATTRTNYKMPSN